MFLTLAVCVTQVQAADPSGGWLSYAVYTAPQPTDIITRMAAVMTVPDTPKSKSGSPAFWFGTQTAKGDGALIQPIMAKWLGDGFYMFQEIFDWTDMNDKQSKPFLVKPGDVITAEVNYVKEFGGLYMMNMTSKNTGAVSNYHYKLLPGQRETESVGYFVLEHQPQSCDELPPNGIVKWTNITVEVNNKPVAQPLFVAKQESPTCNSKAEVIDSSTVSITWGQ